MFNPNFSLFVPVPEGGTTFQPNPNSIVQNDEARHTNHLDFFKFVGRIVGKALYDGLFVDAYFTRSLYKHMLDMPLTYLVSPPRVGTLSGLLCIHEGKQPAIPEVALQGSQACSYCRFSQDAKLEDSVVRANILLSDTALLVGLMGMDAVLTIAFTTSIFQQQQAAHHPAALWSPTKLPKTSNQTCLTLEGVLQDIEGVDPSYFKTLTWLLENDITDVLDLNFTEEVDYFGRKEVKELKQGGRDVKVTEANKREYINLKAQHYMTTAIRGQLDAFLGGFWDLIPKVRLHWWPDSRRKAMFPSSKASNGVPALAHKKCPSVLAMVLKC